MLDDPLCLAVQVIAVLAAGMYPVGFMFGVCSDCCGCPPCVDCSHYNNTEPSCDFRSVPTSPNPTVFTGISLAIVDVASADANAPINANPNLEFSIPEEELPDSGTASLGCYRIESVATQNECGCQCCQIELLIEMGASDNTGELAYETILYGELCECSQTVITFDTESQQVVEWGVRQDSMNDSTAWKNYAESLHITASLEIDACACGACCDPATGDCTDNVGEGVCDGTFQGADTTCDPNPCPQPPDGACCDAATGNCTQTTEANCGGIWSEGVECDPNPCEQPPTGACCDEEEGCTETTQANCAGTWLEGVDCDPNPCVLGACCDPFGGCADDARQDECSSAYSQWFSGQTCEEAECPPAGTCCEYIDGVLDSSSNFTEHACDQTEVLEGIDTVWQEGIDGECPPTNP